MTRASNRFGASGRQSLHPPDSHLWRTSIRWRVIGWGVDDLFENSVSAEISLCASTGDMATLFFTCGTESSFVEEMSRLKSLRDEIDACMRAMREAADTARKSAGPGGWGAEPESERGDAS